MLSRTSMSLLPFIMACVACAGPCIAAATHPMSALTMDEFGAVRQILGSAGHLASDARFPNIDLKEPKKADVLAWTPEHSLDRMANAIVRQGGETYQAEVNLTQHTVERWRRIEGAQTGISSEEWSAAQSLTKASPVWQERMRLRGYTSFDAVFCEAYSTGYFGDEAEKRRLVKVPCFDISQNPNNLYGRPIEGLFSIVDLTKPALVDLVDTGPAPIAAPSNVGSTAAGAVGEDDEPSVGTAIELSGDRVQWNAWSFHLRFERRPGVVLSLVSFKDADRERPVAYQANVSEMFVPYMDPDVGWSYRTFMDVGEFGFGSLASLLVEGVDCPGGARFLAPVLPTETGRPYVASRRVCLFERKLDYPLWRHSESLNGTFAGRSGRELVVRSIATVGNYDYLLDYVFDENGAFRIEVGATGYPAVKGVIAENMASPTAATDTATGTLVDRQLVAVNHDHFLSFRIDLDVDGVDNSFVRERLVKRDLPAENARKSLWRLERMPTDTEKGFSAGHVPEVWRVINPNKVSPLGEHPGFEILPGHSATSLLSENDWPQRRASFSANQLWVTRYKADERYAGGDYPNQSHGGDGLPIFANSESIENADLVVWYTMGFHHVTRPEDWPIQSTIWHGVTFRPFSFFAGNPSATKP